MKLKLLLFISSLQTFAMEAPESQGQSLDEFRLQTKLELSPHLTLGEKKSQVGKCLGKIQGFLEKFQQPMPLVFPQKACNQWFIDNPSCSLTLLETLPDYFATLEAQQKAVWNPFIEELSFFSIRHDPLFNPDSKDKISTALEVFFKTFLTQGDSLNAFQSIFWAENISFFQEWKILSGKLPEQGLLEAIENRLQTNGDFLENPFMIVFIQKWGKSFCEVYGMERYLELFPQFVARRKDGGGIEENIQLCAAFIDSFPPSATPPALKKKERWVFKKMLKLLKSGADPKFYQKRLCPLQSLLKKYGNREYLGRHVPIVPSKIFNLSFKIKHYWLHSTHAIGMLLNFDETYQPAPASPFLGEAILKMPKYSRYIGVPFLLKALRNCLNSSNGYLAFSVVQELLRRGVLIPGDQFKKILDFKKSEKLARERLKRKNFKLPSLRYRRKPLALSAFKGK